MGTHPLQSLSQPTNPMQTKASWGDCKIDDSTGGAAPMYRFIAQAQLTTPALTFSFAAHGYVNRERATERSTLSSIPAHEYANQDSDFHQSELVPLSSTRARNPRFS